MKRKKGNLLDRMLDQMSMAVPIALGIIIAFGLMSGIFFTIQRCTDWERPNIDIAKEKPKPESSVPLEIAERLKECVEIEASYEDCQEELEDRQDLLKVCETEREALVDYIELGCLHHLPDIPGLKIQPKP